MNITTTYKTNAQGTGQIVAKANGKQRTVNFDHSLSVDGNHGVAAAVLSIALGLPWSPDITHRVKNNGSHVFTFPSST